MTRIDAGSRLQACPPCALREPEPPGGARLEASSDLKVEPKTSDARAHVGNRSHVGITRS